MRNRQGINKLILGLWDDFSFLRYNLAVNIQISLVREMATYSSTLAWRIPQTDCGLAGHSPRGRKELDMTEHNTFKYPKISYILPWCTTLCSVIYHNGTIIILFFVWTQNLNTIIWTMSILKKQVFNIGLIKYIITNA